MKTDLIYETKDNEKLRLSLYGKEGSENKNCVIVSHGFKGFKDWGFFPHIAGYLEEKGYFVITFNYSLNGVGENKTEFTELDKFKHNSYSREVEELNELTGAYRNNFFGNGGNGKLAYLGHSRGGADVILTAARRNDISALVTWASIAELDRYSDRQKKEWREKGSFGIKNARTGQLMELGMELLDDIENKKEELSLSRAVSSLRIPWLIAHGEQDMAVPVKEAEQLYEWSDKSKTELFTVKNTGHTFNAVHPFEGTNDKLETLLQKTDNFLKSVF